MGIEILQSAEEMTGIAPAWNELARRCPGYWLSQTFQWADVAWRTVARPAGGTLHCVVLRDENRLVGVWPLVARAEQGHVVVRPLGFEGSEYSAPLVESGDAVPCRVEALLQAAARLGDVLQLIHVRSDSPLAAALARRRRLARRHDALTVSWIRRADYADWEAFAATLGAKFRNELRRGAKRLAARGRVEMAIAEAGERAALVDWMLALKREWLDRTAQRNDWLARPSYRDFLIEMLGRGDDTGALMLFVLKVDGAPVAASLVSRDPQRLEGYLSVFDPAWAAAGNVLLEHVLAWAFARGLDIDFRIGDESYKKRWHTRAVPAASWHIATSARGIMPVIVWPLVNRLHAAARRRMGLR